MAYFTLRNIPLFSECSHKEERNNRRFLARKCDLISGDIDTLRHKWAAGDPAVRKYDRRPWCTACKCDSHYTHSCKAGQYGPMSMQDDSLINFFFCTEDTEPEEQRDILEQLFNIWEV